MTQAQLHTAALVVIAVALVVAVLFGFNITE